MQGLKSLSMTLLTCLLSHLFVYEWVEVLLNLCHQPQPYLEVHDGCGTFLCKFDADLSAFNWIFGNEIICGCLFFKYLVSIFMEYFFCIYVYFYFLSARLAALLSWWVGVWCTCIALICSISFNMLKLKKQDNKLMPYCFYIFIQVWCCQLHIT